MALIFEPTEQELEALLKSREDRLERMQSINAPAILQRKEQEMIDDAKKRLAAFRKEKV